MSDHRPVLDRYPIPADLSGKRCLDVATMDGYWALRWNAVVPLVTALDLRPEPRARHLRLRVLRRPAPARQGPDHPGEWKGLRGTVLAQV